MRKITIGLLALVGLLSTGFFILRLTTSFFGFGLAPSRERVYRRVAPQPLRPLPAPRGRVGLEPEVPSEGKFEEEAPPREAASLSERLVIKTGSMSLLVADVRKTVANIIKFTEDEGGFVLSSDVHRATPESKRLVGRMTIKVPAEKFSRVFKRLKDFGLKVTSENISGQDVTTEYTDLASRLRNLEAAEAQLLELMKKAGKVSEILEVQRELVRTREQIETTRGRIEFLEKNAKMATITIHLSTEEEKLPIVEEGWRPKKVAKRALRSLVRFWQKVGNIVIWSAIFFSPFVVLGGAILALRRLKRKKRK